MKAIGYRKALQWLADNDDCEWILEEPNDNEETPSLSVAASLVADIYGLSDARVHADLLKLLRAT